MGILDDAIKEHLELKRQHGAGEDELRKLEDEAFGAAERPGEPGSAPDALTEAPTEFMAQPEPAESVEPAEARRPRPDVADLQEAPPAAPEAEPEQPPAEEEAPAIEQAIPEPPVEPEPPAEVEPEPAGPSTEEREAIAEQPTELYDVEDELGGPPAPAPTEDELVEEEMQEPRLAPVDPLSGVADAEEEEEDDAEREADDFFDEKRLSDELDQALEGPSVDDEDEAELEDDAELAEEELEEDEERPAEGGEEDVLEETPDFLEEAPEDDQLWFEQKPPKDFDFDD
jgi:hypothetical protein